LSRIEQELEGLGRGDIWKNKGGDDDDDNNIWSVVSKRFMDIERQNMEASMGENTSLVLYIELRSNWKKEIHKEVCTHEARRGIGW
jgi:hypothetical protein